MIIMILNMQLHVGIVDSKIENTKLSQLSQLYQYLQNNMISTKITVIVNWFYFTYSQIHQYVHCSKKN